MTTGESIRQINKEINGKNQNYSVKVQMMNFLFVICIINTKAM